jgi:hypothetical protein
VKELEGTDWKDREKAEALWSLKWWCASACFVGKAISSPTGGGVVSVELRPSLSSEIPDTVGDADERSESTGRGASAAGSESTFILTRTVAASRSWTCWCLEMRSFEV